MSARPKPKAAPAPRKRKASEPEITLRTAQPMTAEEKAEQVAVERLAARYSLEELAIQMQAEAPKRPRRGAVKTGVPWLLVRAIRLSLLKQGRPVFNVRDGMPGAKDLTKHVAGADPKDELARH